MEELEASLLELRNEVSLNLYSFLYDIGKLEEVIIYTPWVTQDQLLYLKAFPVLPQHISFAIG